MTVGGHTATTKTLGVAELRKLPVHRHAGIFRVLDGDERDRLRASMRTGYDEAHPIVVWKKTNEIVDGRNRRDLAVELKCTNVPVAFVAFPSEDDVTGFIIAQNLARRHLTTRERAKLAGRLVVNGASVRSAAKTAGVSKSTTQRAANKARTRARVPSGTPVRARTTGADGKSYPATKPKPKPRSSRAAKPAESKRLPSGIQVDTPRRELEQQIAGQLRVYDLAAIETTRLKAKAATMALVTARDAALDELPPQIAQMVREIDQWTRGLARISDASDGLEGRPKELVAAAVTDLVRSARRLSMRLQEPAGRSTT